MANNLLTGSENIRFKELQNYWLVFEPISNPDYAVLYPLYTMPLGQQQVPELTIFSGGYIQNSGAITIEKIVHRFEDDTDATNFLTEIGPENIASYIEKTNIDELGQESKVIEIQVINHPVLDFSFDLIHGKIEKGFYLEVFRSGSIASGGVKHITQNVEYDKFGNISSDTYLKYFKIEGD